MTENARAASDHRAAKGGASAQSRDQDPPKAVVMPLVAATPWAYRATEGGQTAADASGIPQWLRDLQNSNWWQGFYHQDKDFAAFFTDRGPGTLFVTFDANVSDARPRQAPHLWAHELCRTNNWSQLEMSAFRPHWYRDQSVIDYLVGLKDDGFFDRFQRVVFAGLSMGGSAACAFARLAPGCQVIAFSPQSTLSPQRVPWDRRFPAAGAVDWSGPFGDAAGHLDGARQVHLVYDPREPNDRRHAARLDGANVTHLHAVHAGHKSSVRLLQARLLDAVVEQIVAGRCGQPEFRTLYRQARLHPWYLDVIGQMLHRKQRGTLLQRVADFAASHNRPMVARALRAMVDELRRQPTRKGSND